MMEKKFFKLKGKTLTIIDWYNVYRWKDVLKWEVDIEKLYNYLKSYSEIYEIRLYFGLDKSIKSSKEIHYRIKNLGYYLVSKDVKWVPVRLERSHFKKLYKKTIKIISKIRNEDIQNFLNRISDFSTQLKETLHQVRMGFSFENGVYKNLIKPLFTTNELQGLYSQLQQLKENFLQLDKTLNKLTKRLKHPIKARKCDFDSRITLDVLTNINNFDGLILFSGDGDFKDLCEFLLDNQKQVIVVHPFGARGKEYNELLERPKGSRPYLCAVEKLTAFIKKSTPGVNTSPGRDI